MVHASIEDFYVPAWVVPGRAVVQPTLNGLSNDDLLGLVIDCCPASLISLSTAIERWPRSTLTELGSAKLFPQHEMPVHPLRTLYPDDPHTNANLCPICQLSGSGKSAGRCMVSVRKHCCVSRWSSHHRSSTTYLHQSREFASSLGAALSNDMVGERGFAQVSRRASV